MEFELLQGGSEPFRSAPMNSPSSASSAVAGFPVVAASVVGILIASVLLLGYYVFVTRCIEDVARRHGGSAANKQCGLDEAAIRGIPTLRYRQFSSGGGECAVCLREFQPEERIRLLPDCLHVFHIDCADAWLQSSANCPLCRARVAAPAPSNPVAVAMVRRLEQGRKVELFVSRGDECVDVGGKAERACVQPMRRSFSMDSSTDTQLHMALQRILQLSSRAENGDTGGGIFRRSLFSFGRSSSRGSVLPLQMELR